MAQIGTIKLQTQSNGAVDVPVFDTGDSGSDIYEFVRVETASGTGFIPVEDTSNATYPYLRVKSQSHGTVAMTDRSVVIPDSAVFHFDASRLDANDNDTISTLTDVSGNNNDATQRSGTASYRESGINGIPAVDFNNEATFDVPQILDSTNSAEIMMVFQADSSNSDCGLWQFTSAGNKTRYIYEGSQIYENFAGDDRYVDGVNSTLDISTPHIYAVSFDGSTGTVYQNDTEVSSGSASFSVPSDTYIIGTNLQDKNDTAGVISELLIHNRNLTNTERQNEWNRLSNKFGISL